MIKYQSSTKGITAKQLEGFFAEWPKRPSPQTHLKLLKKSAYVLIAMDTEKNKVAGFITAITDGVLTAYIPFLEVHKEYQSRGIGSKLIKRMLAKLHNFYIIDLACDPELQDFYKKFGMKKYTAMIIRNYEHQTGE